MQPITNEAIVLTAIIAIAGIVIVALTIPPIVGGGGRAKIEGRTPNGARAVIDVKTDSAPQPPRRPRNSQPRRKRKKPKNRRGGNV